MRTLRRTATALALVTAASRPPAGTRLVALTFAMATDKVRYAPRGTITLEIVNDLEQSVWHVHYPQPDPVFWELEQAARDNAWRPLEVRSGSTTTVEANL